MIDISIPFTILLILYAYCIIKIIHLKKLGKRITLRVIVSVIGPEFVLGYDIIKKGIVRYHN